MSDVAATNAVFAEPKPVSSFEFWPAWMFYTPIVAYWIALGVRYGDFSLPSAANPRISTGGLCGESKSSILDLAGPAAKPWIAPYVRLTTGEQDKERASALMARAGLDLPIVIKPDIGCNGSGVRLVHSEQALHSVLAAFPRNVDVLLQKLVPYEGEAGIFYIRHPNEASGSITSLTHKQAPILFGDGRSTIHELVLANPRTKLVPHIYLPRLHLRLNEVPSAGTPIRLVFAGNHCRGSIFLNGATDITDALTAAVAGIIDDIPDFHFGRIDVRYQNVASLRNGKGFQIIEINGVGSEATHIWDPTTRLYDAYKAQFSHYRQAFEIGAANRAAGIKSSGLRRMYRDWRVQRRLMASYPLND